MPVTEADILPRKLTDGAGVVVELRGRKPAVGHGEHAIGHFGEHGIVGDHDGEGAEFAIDTLDCFENEDAGFNIERAGGFIAEQDIGTLGDGTGDGDALLFAAGELSGEMVGSRSEADEFEGFIGAHGVPGYFRDQPDVFTGSQTGDEVVELKHEADDIAAVGGDAFFAGAADVPIAIVEGAGGGLVEATDEIEQGRLPRA